MGRDKIGFLKDESRRDGWHDLPFGVLVPVWQGKEGDIHLVTPKDRVGVTSHLTPLSCKPLDRCMGNGLA